MENAHNVAKGSSGSHTTVDMTEFQDLFNQLVAEDRDAGQPEGWYTSSQIVDSTGISRTRVQRLLKDGVRSGKIEFQNINWVDWDGVNRQHRCFRIKEE